MARARALGDGELHRFFSKFTQRSPTECWPWTATIDRDGYGRMKVGGKSQRAHRLAYALRIGPVPDGLSVLHRCDNPCCVNPDHLWVGTSSDNMRDMATKGRGVPPRYNAAKTHCPRRHIYDEANTYISPDGRRHCRACAREHERRYRARVKARM
jgi:hypothetical protein